MKLLGVQKKKKLEIDDFLNERLQRKMWKSPGVLESICRR
jgi:hypothetical protein